MDKLARELELLEVDAAGSRVARLRDGERALLLEAFPQVPTHLRTNNKCQSRRARAASSRPPRLRGSSVSLHCHLPQLLFPAVGAGKSKCRRLGWGDCSWEGGKLRAAPGAQAATSFFSQLPASDLARGDSPRAHVAMRLLEAPSPPKPLAPPPPKAGGCAPLLRSTNKPQGAPCRPSPPKAGGPRLRRAARITREGRQALESWKSSPPAGPAAVGGAGRLGEGLLLEQTISTGLRFLRYLCHDVSPMDLARLMIGTAARYSVLRPSHEN